MFTANAYDSRYCGAAEEHTDGYCFFCNQLRELMQKRGTAEPEVDGVLIKLWKDELHKLYGETLVKLQQDVNSELRRK